MNDPSAAVAQARRLREQAIEHIRANRTQAAEDALQALIGIQPQDVPACLELARLMAVNGRFRGSSKPLLVAMQHLPRHAPLLLDLAEELTPRGEIVAARACLDFLSQAPNPPADILVRQARLRYELGEISRARELIQRAITAGADAPYDHQLHAMLLEYSGRTDAAREVLQACIRRWPGFGNAAVALIRMCRQTPQDNRLDDVEQQLRSLPAAAGDPSVRANVASFEYTRFKILDDLGRHAEAWPALVRSNALMSELKPYDAEVVRSLTDSLVAMPPMQPGPRQPPAVEDAPVPIFIVGLPRSGTTLLDRMLSAHSQVVSAGELIEFWRQLCWVADELPQGVYFDALCQVAQRIDDVDMGEVGRRYLEQTRWRAGSHRFYIDKLPANFQMVALIRRALPQARILNVVRDPMDVCFSSYKLFGGQSRYIHDLDAIADYHGQYVRLCRHWHQLSPDMMLDVPYAALVREPRAMIERVLAYCGLQFEEACLHPERNASPVATPSSSQVREAIHTRGIGQWKAYANQLEPLRKALG